VPSESAQPESSAGTALALRTFLSIEHGEEQEDIACPLCGAHQPAPVLIARDLLFARPGGYPLVRCARCDMQYVSPRPTGAALGKHYPDDYFGYSLHEDAPRLIQPFLRAMARSISLRRLGYLEEVTGKLSADAKLLDVGCGVNRLLSCIKEERGCIGTGLDFKPEIVAYVRERLQMPIVQGTLENAGFADGAHDVVLMMEYLEHELDPRGTLVEARRVLRAGGHLALELPYIGWAGRMFGPNWWNLDIPRHLMFFTPDTLAKMLAQCGFELVSVRPFTLPLYVGMSMVQALGLRHWRKYKDVYPILSTLLALPLVPFTALMPEFMFAVARAK
jgi:SAM-dependent methyltransferase